MNERKSQRKYMRINKKKGFVKEREKKEKIKQNKEADKKERKERGKQE